ncbi:hypothetical protein OH77DRAFT_754376 [Trametes cingulata]|nr:hypothetical protein OH77DRAFT_754376 [Trametes cingulata]
MSRLRTVLPLLLCIWSSYVLEGVWADAAPPDWWPSCSDPTFSWVSSRIFASESVLTRVAVQMNNALGQTPCMIVQDLVTVCNGLSLVLLVFPFRSGRLTCYTGGLQANESLTIQNLQESDCACNTVTYSLVFACGLCANETALQQSETEYFVQYMRCSGFAVQSYPMPIPSDTQIPAWAYLDLTENDSFDVEAAQFIAAERELAGVGHLHGPPSTRQSATGASAGAPSDTVIQTQVASQALVTRTVTASTVTASSQPGSLIITGSPSSPVASDPSSSPPHSQRPSATGSVFTSGAPGDQHASNSDPRASPEGTIAPVPTNSLPSGSAGPTTASPIQSAHSRKGVVLFGAGAGLGTAALLSLLLLAFVVHRIRRLRQQETEYSEQESDSHLRSQASDGASVAGRGSETKRLLTVRYRRSAIEGDF